MKPSGVIALSGFVLVLCVGCAYGLFRKGEVGFPLATVVEKISYLLKRNYSHWWRTLFPQVWVGGAEENLFIHDSKSGTPHVNEVLFFYF